MRYDLSGIVVDLDEESSYQHNSHDTLDYMGWTCPDVDGITSDGGCEARDNIERWIEKLTGAIASVVEEFRVVDGKHNFTHEIGRKLVEAITWHIEDDDIAETVDNLFYDVRTDIKERVTYPWRNASVHMMDSAYSSGWYAAIDHATDEIEEAISDQRPDEEQALDEFKADLREAQSDVNEYAYWVNWNRDMGNALPEITGKFPGNSPRTMDMFEIAEHGLQPSKMFWGPGNPDIVQPDEIIPGKRLSFNNLRGAIHDRGMRYGLSQGRFLTDEVRKNLPIEAFLAHGFNRYSVTSVVEVTDGPFGPRTEIWALSDKAQLRDDSEYTLVWRK